MFEHTKNIVIKVTRDCNLRCKYCYVADKDNYRGEVMPLEIFKQLVQRISSDKIKAGTQGNEVQLTFHGGEPTIVGEERLREYLDYASYHLTTHNIAYTFGIQTNATLLTDNMLQLFHDYNVSVGLSFDGVSGSNSFRNNLPVKRYLEVVENLKRYHLSFGSIIVVTPQNINNTVKNIKFFKKIGLSGKFNYAEDVLNVGGCEVPGEDFFKKVFIPLYFEYGHPDGFTDSNIERIIHSFFRNRLSFIERTSYLNFVKDEEVTICAGTFCGGGKYVVEVSPDGSINYCGRYDKDSEDCNMGSIFSSDFLGLYSLKNYLKTIYRKNEASKKLKCDLCPAYAVCDHGCMAFNYVKTKEWGIRDDLVCPYYRKVYSFLCTYERDAFLRYYASSRSPRSRYLYLPVSSPVTQQSLHPIENYLHRLGLSDFQVEKDEEWKSSNGQSYQIKIKLNKDPYNGLLRNLQ